MAQVGSDLATAALADVLKDIGSMKGWSAGAKSTAQAKIMLGMEAIAYLQGQADGQENALKEISNALENAITRSNNGESGGPG